jgi:MYXO-CTERM domain-containing protein
MKRSVLSLLSLLVTLGRAQAETGTIPEVGAGSPGCTSPPMAGPVFDSVVPANIPGFLFWPAGYPGYTKPIEAYALRLREGTGEEVPILVEKLPETGPVLDNNGPIVERYVVRPQRALRPGAAILSFDDDCGPTFGAPLTAPMRNERYRYKVALPLLLPTKIGTARQTNFQTVDGTACGLRRVDFRVDFDAQLATFPLVRIDVRAPDGRSLEAGFNRYDPRRAEGGLLLACTPSMGGPRFLRPGETVVTIYAEVLGGQPLPPLTLNLNAECPRDSGCETPARLAPDAGVDRAVYESEDVQPPPDLVSRNNAFEDGVALPPDAATPDVAAPPPDAAVPAVAADAAEVVPDAGAAPALATDACSCRVDGRAHPGAWLWPAALAALIWVRRRRTASRTRPGRPGRCTRSAG